MLSVPASSSDLYPEWFSEALGCEVTGVEVLDEASATNHRLRLRLSFLVPGAGPPSVFVKLPPLDPGHRQMIGANSMGEREVQFYTDVAPSTELRVPRAHVAVTADNGDYVLVLEDLAAGGCQFSDGGWGVEADAAAGALEGLATFHARFGNPAVRDMVAPWLAVPRQGWGDMVVELLRMVLDEQSDMLTSAYIAAGNMYADHWQHFDRVWEAGPQTYIHGDPHIGNVFLDAGEVGFHDWGLSRVGTPLRDVSYFLTMTVDPEERRRNERDLLRLYLGTLRAAGGPNINFDDAWFAHRVQTGYTVLATFLVFMPGYAGPEAQVLGGDLRRRAELALEDLDVVDAMKMTLS
ncbi:MAG TPA: phosphotransferase [Acidimicrobiales bacterium]